MIVLGQAAKAYLVRGPTDFRKGFDSLIGIAQLLTGNELMEGHLFVFCNRRRTRLRIVFLDKSGAWVATKRLHGGTFRWLSEAADGRPAVLDREEFAMIVGGLDPADYHQRKWLRMSDDR